MHWAKNIGDHPSPLLFPKWRPNVRFFFSFFFCVGCSSRERGLSEWATTDVKYVHSDFFFRKVLYRWFLYLHTHAFPKSILLFFENPSWLHFVLGLPETRKLEGEVLEEEEKSHEEKKEIVAKTAVVRRRRKKHSFPTYFAHWLGTTRRKWQINSNNNCLFPLLSETEFARLNSSMFYGGINLNPIFFQHLRRIFFILYIWESELPWFLFSAHSPESLFPLLVENFPAEAETESRDVVEA